MPDDVNEAHQPIVEASILEALSKRRSLSHGEYSGRTIEALNLSSEKSMICGLSDFDIPGPNARNAPPVSELLGDILYVYG